MPPSHRLPERPTRTGAALVRLAGALAVASACWAASGPASAQDPEVKGLVDRLDRLQRELVTLQRHVYRGEPPPPAPAEAAGLSSAAAARIESRLSQFEAELRQLTGRVEELAHRQTQLRAQLDRLAADLEPRLQRLERGAPAVVGSLGAPGRQQQQQAAVPQASPGQPDLAPGPRVIGTVDPKDLEALRAEPVAPGSQAPAQGATESARLGTALQGQTPDEQYQYAFSLLSQANYGEAERALRAFVEQHPDSPLAGNAKYWLGETYYVRQDYQNAAITFAEAYQEYPDNAKAPDNLLKLGMSLASLGSTEDACGTFAELLKRYPDAAVTLLQRARQERQRLACP